MSSNPFFSVEIFPKIGSNFASVKGNVEMSFQGIKFLILSSNKPTGLSVSKGVSASWGLPNYHQLRLLVQKGVNDANPFVKSEVICDLLSMSTNNYINYFTPLIDEYSSNGGWTAGSEFPKRSVKNSLTNLYSNRNFIDYPLLSKLLTNVEKNTHMDKLLAAFHLNRLAKYKAFSHVTEAVADCISSLEALYMEEKGDREDGFSSIIPLNEIKRAMRKGTSLKQEVLVWFIKKYYKGDQEKIADVEKHNVYKIRSAYLHRGLLKEPLNGNTSIISLDKLQEQLLYNSFFDVCYNSILNFTLMS